jgi:hypothetical protein
MILPLRQRHRRVFAVLGVLLPLAFVFGIAARRTVPNAATLPPELSLWAQHFAATDYERDDLFSKSPVQVRLWREQGTGRLAVELNAASDFLKPDLLVYWSAGQPAGDALPPNASLLGAFVAGPLALPEEASVSDGSLILFSLADQEIVDVSKPVRFNASTLQLSIKR